jgi:hypothetical protein
VRLSGREVTLLPITGESGNVSMMHH